MKKLSPYAGEKGNLQLPLAQRIPYELIDAIAKVKARQNAAKAATGRERTRRKA
jgi:hypothetical protein